MRQILKKGKTGTSTNDLLGIRFRRKGSDEVKFLLKESTVIGYLKCQLCKIKFKINEVEDHLSKQKHTKKMEEVSMVLYTNKDCVKEPLPVTTCVISPPMPLGSSTNAIVSMKNVQNQKTHENKSKTNITKESVDPSKTALSKTAPSKIPKLLQKKVPEKFPQRLEINSRENINFLSQDGMNNMKRLLYNICQNDFRQIQSYDIENNWKILLIHAGDKLAWCIYKLGMINAFITKTNNLIAIPKENEYTNLLSLYRSVIQQPHVEVLKQHCNITYQIWPRRRSLEQGIELNGEHNISGCFTDVHKCLTSTVEPREQQRTIQQTFEQKCVNLSIDFAHEMQYSAYKSSHLHNMFDTFISLETKTFEKTSDLTENDEQNLSLQTITNGVIKDYPQCEKTDSPTYNSTDKSKVTKLEEELQTIDVDTKSETKPSSKESEQGLSNNWINNDANLPKPSSVEPMTLERFKQEYVKLGIDQLINIKYRVYSYDWVSMVQPRGFRFFCKLCGSNSGHKDIEAHVRGARHAKKAERIKGMHHPLYYNTLGENPPIIPASLPALVEEKPAKIELNTEVPKTIRGTFTLEQFKREYAKFPIKDLLCIRYRLETADWDDLIMTDQIRYYCRLCGCVPVGNMENVALHISGIRHAAKVDLIIEMQHPNYVISPALEEEEDAQSQHTNESEASTRELDESCTNSTGNSEITDIITESSNGSNSADTPLEIFKRDYVNLDVSELLKVKCRTVNKDWFPMITKAYGERYYCNMCRRRKLVGDHRNLEQHIKGARHVRMLGEVIEMYPLLSDSDQDPPVVNTPPIIRETTSEVVVQTQQSGGANTYPLDEFKCRYVALDIKELLKIEYKLKSGKREFMIVEENGNVVCQLCQSGPLGSNVVNHFLGARHVCRIHDLVDMYHPQCSLSVTGSQVGQYDLSSHSTVKDASIVDKTGNSETTDSRTGTLNKSLGDGMSLKNLKQDHVYMNISQLRKIKCRTDESKDWFPMISKTFEGWHNCNICNKRLTKEARLQQHLMGYYHTRIVEKIVEMTLVDGDQSGSPEIFTLNEFKYQYVSLDVNEILKIKCESNCGKREYMLIEEKGSYTCQLCEKGPITVDFLTHLLGRRHISKVQDLVAMYHPQCSLSIDDSKDGNCKRVPIDNDHGLKFFVQDSNERQSNDSINSSEMRDDLINCTKSWGRRREEMISERTKAMNLEIEKIKSISTSGSPYSCDTTRKQISTDFIASHGFLSIDELFEVQFKTSDLEWHYMLGKNPLNYVCNLCNRESLKKKEDVYVHIRGEYHAKKMAKAVKLYHPKYCPLVDETEDYYSDVDYDERTPAFQENAASHPGPTMPFFRIPLPMYPQTHAFGSEWWDITKDMKFEDFKLKYINSNVENLLKIEYKDNEGEWRLMLEDLDGEVYCNLCGHVNLLDKNQMFVRAHVRGSLHMGNMQYVTGIRHPDFCALRGTKKVVISSPPRNHYSNDTTNTTSPKPLPKPSPNRSVFRSADEYKKSIVNLRMDDFDELLKIEFQGPNSVDWKPLIAKTATRYVCNLCWGINLLDKVSVMAHIKSTFHQGNLTNAPKIHHPLKFPAKEKEKAKDGLHPTTLENNQTVDDKHYLGHDWNTLYSQKFSTKDVGLVHEYFRDEKLQKLISEIEDLNDDNHVCDLTCRIVFMELIFPRLARNIAENCSVNSKTSITEELVNSIFKDTEAFCKNGCILNWINKGFENKKRKVADNSNTTDILSKYYTDLGTPVDNITGNANLNTFQVYNCSTDYRTLLNSRPSSSRLLNASNQAFNLERQNIEASLNSRSPETTTFENFMAILARLSDLEDFLGMLGPTSISLLAEAIRIRRDQLSTQSEKELIVENLEFLKDVQIKLGTALQSYRLAPEREIAAAKVVKDITMFLRVASRQQHMLAANNNANANNNAQGR